MESDFELDFEEPFEEQKLQGPSLNESPRAPTLDDVQRELLAAEPNSEPEEFEVEKIIGCMVDEDTGIKKYLIAWKNWPGPPTWEPETECDCEDLIEEFHRNQKKQEAVERVNSKKIKSPPRKKMARGRPLSQKKIRAPEPQSPEVITLSSSEDEDNYNGDDANLLLSKLESVDESSSSFEEKSSIDDNKKGMHQLNLHDQSFNVKPRLSQILVTPPPPPPRDGHRLNVEQGYRALLERRLNLDKIVGTTDYPEKLVIVKWQNIALYEKVPLHIFRQFWSQELLDFLIKHIEFE